MQAGGGMQAGAGRRGGMQAGACRGGGGMQAGGCRQREGRLSQHHFVDEGEGRQACEAEGDEAGVYAGRGGREWNVPKISTKRKTNGGIKLVQWKC
jgi:hypothetical protein